MQLFNPEKEFWLPMKALVSFRKIYNKFKILGSIGKRLEPLGLENNEENARVYRQLLFSTDNELAKYISGVIMFDQTFFQSNDQGVRFTEVLKSKGIIPGIKVSVKLIDLYSIIFRWIKGLFQWVELKAKVPHKVLMI